MDCPCKNLPGSHSDLDWIVYEIQQYNDMTSEMALMWYVFFLATAHYCLSGECSVLWCPWVILSLWLQPVCRQRSCTGESIYCVTLDILL